MDEKIVSIKQLIATNPGWVYQACVAYVKLIGLFTTTTTTIIIIIKQRTNTQNTNKHKHKQTQKKSFQKAFHGTCRRG